MDLAAALGLQNLIDRVGGGCRRQDLARSLDEVENGSPHGKYQNQNHYEWTETGGFLLHFNFGGEHLGFFISGSRRIIRLIFEFGIDDSWHCFTPPLGTCCRPLKPRRNAT